MTPNEIIKERFPNEPTQKIADDLGLSYSKVANRAYCMGIKKSQEFMSSMCSGRSNLIKGGIKYRFTPGHTPANKGKRMDDQTYQKVKKTMFKKGNRPQNWKPEGTIVERKDSNNRSYLYYKISDSNWVLYHKKIWIDYHGNIPAKHVISFKDGNTFNCDISNLELISMAKNAIRNSIHRFPAELKELIKLKSKLTKKINNGKK